MTEEPQILPLLAQAVGAADPDAPLPMRMCQAVARLVEADGGAIGLIQPASERLTLCSTDGVADRIEDLQNVLGEGPAHDAIRERRAVMGSLAGVQSERWPLFAPAALEAVGPVTIHVFPMHLRNETVGTITVYLSGGRPLARSVQEAQVLVDATGVAIFAQTSGPEEGDALADPWPERDMVNQATGMVVAQLGVSPDDALALLHAHAFAHETTLRKVAEDVLERRQHFKPGQGSDGEAS